MAQRRGGGAQPERPGRPDRADRADRRATDSNADVSRTAGAPHGYPVRRAPDWPEGVTEPGDVPAVDELAEPVEPNDTEIYVGDLEAEGAAADPRLSLESLTDLELRSDETTDPIEAIEEGMPFVAPIDPVISGVQDDGDPVVAAGFSPDALAEPYDGSHHSTFELDEDEMVERVRDALRTDAQTSAYAEALDIEVVGGRAVIAGVVADLEDEDAVTAVAERVTGIREVDDRLVVASVEEPGGDPRGSAAQ